MGVEHIKVNREKIIEVIKTSLDARENNFGIFNEIKKTPEQDYIDLIKKHGEKINDDKFATNALFFTTAMVHGDNTELLFKRIAKEKLIKKYDWLFKSDILLTKSPEEVISTCFEFYRPGGYNSAAFDQWIHNSSVLENKYQGDIRNFFKKNNNDATQIINSLVVRTGAKTSEKKEFRRFGPKLSRLFVQWVNQYDFYKLDNIDLNGIPVDFQISRILIQTNGIELSKVSNTQDVTSRVILPTLVDIFATEDFVPRKVSEALFFIGSRCCNKGRHNLCPLEELCTSMISRESYDRYGKFDPKDTGRFDI